MPWVSPPRDPTTIVFRPYASGGGKCYHAGEKFMRCVSWMSGSTLPLSEAIARELRPCRRCFGYQQEPADDR